MAEADDKVITTPTRLPWSTPVVTHIPMAHAVEARFEGKGGLQVDPHRHQMIDLDGPPPQSGKEWLANAAEQLAAQPNSPARVTSAARETLAKQMNEAFLRRQVNEVWTWPSIKNFLTRRKFWPSRKRRTP